MTGELRVLAYLAAAVALTACLKSGYDALIDRGRGLERAVWVQRDRDQMRANETESMRRLAAQEASDRESQNQRAAVRAAGLRADRLRNERDEAIAQRRAADPAPEGQCAATRADADLYADLYRRADDRAGELAAEAEAYRIAGQQCERDYDALKAGEP